jgi:hypothetical protein
MCVKGLEIKRLWLQRHPCGVTVFVEMSYSGQRKRSVVPGQETMLPENETSP